MKAVKLKAVSVAVSMALGARMHRGIASYLERGGLMLNALAPVVDKIDAVPEAQRGWYVEKEGKFHLDPAKIDIEDTSGLKSALEKERKAARDAEKARKEFEARFIGIDPEKVKELMAKFDGDEEGKLIAAGKLDEVLARRTEKQRAQHEKDLKAAADKATAAEARAAKFSQRVLDNHVRAAATKAGVHAGAVEDALFRARTMFTLNEDGNAVQMAADGTVVIGKDGKTPFSPAEWLESMKETAPHWFPANGSGGGAQNGKGGGGGEDLSALSPTARLTAARAGKK